MTANAAPANGSRCKMNDLFLKSSRIKPQEDCVLIIYENAAAREQAIQFCEQMKCEGESDAHWCSFEDLKNPSAGREALNKAADVGMVVFAISAAGDFPPEVKLWMEHWIGKRAEREGMLIGLVTDERSGPRDIACLKEVYLRHLAHRAGMDYLSHLPPLSARRDLLECFDQRAGQVTSVLDEILQAGFASPNIPLR
jgi:hypothetical protein